MPCPMYGEDRALCFRGHDDGVDGFQRLDKELIEAIRRRRSLRPEIGRPESAGGFSLDKY